MMAEKSTEIRALAFVIHTIRPTWPTRLIEESLAKSGKPFDVLADDAIDAARNQQLRTPAVLATHRRPDRPLGDGMQPPPIERCEKCGHIDSDHHNCQPAKPSTDWHNHRRQLAAKYTGQMRFAKDANDHQRVEQLRAEWERELAHG